MLCFSGCLLGSGWAASSAGCWRAGGHVHKNGGDLESQPPPSSIQARLHNLSFSALLSSPAFLHSACYQPHCLLCLLMCWASLHLSSCLLHAPKSYRVHKPTLTPPAHRVLKHLWPNTGLRLPKCELTRGREPQFSVTPWVPRETWWVMRPRLLWISARL